MLLAADVGNTNVKLGIFDGDNLKFKLRFSTDENKTGMVEITKSISEINILSQSNAATTEEISASTEELASTAENIKGKIHNFKV